MTNERIVEEGKSSLSQNTFINDATRAWNNVPESITSNDDIAGNGRP